MSQTLVIIVVTHFLATDHVAEELCSLNTISTYLGQPPTHKRQSQLPYTLTKLSVHSRITGGGGRSHGKWELWDSVSPEIVEWVAEGG
jgi:hypothetical protein